LKSIPGRSSVSKAVYGWAIAGLTLVAVSGCGKGDAEKESQSTNEAPFELPVGGSLVQAKQIGTDEVFEGMGTVAPRLKADLGSKVSSRIVSIAVRLGDSVRQGQVLVTLDSRDLDAQQEVAAAGKVAAMAQVESAKTGLELERRTLLAQVSQAKAGVTQALAARDSAKARLELVVAGPRTQEKRQAGLAVAQAQAQLELANREYRRVKTLVDEGALAARNLDVAVQQRDVAKAAYESAVESQKIAEEGSRTQEVSSAREGLRQAEAGVVQAQAQLKVAEAALKRIDLRGNDVQIAQAQVAQAEANRRLVEANRSYTVITAPFAGKVVARYLDPGSMVNPGVPILAVEGNDRQVVVEVPESAFTKFASIPGNAGVPSATGLFPSLGKEFSLALEESSPSGHSKAHTFTVKFGVPPSAAGVKSGMFARVTLPLGKADKTTNRVVVPFTAVYEKAGFRYVNVSESAASRNTSRRLVTVGRRIASDTRRPTEQGEWVEILSGLKGSEWVDSKPLSSIATPNGEVK